MKAPSKRTLALVKKQMKNLYGIDVKVIPYEQMEENINSGKLFLNEQIGYAAPLFETFGRLLRSDEFASLKYGQLYTLDAPLNELFQNGNGFLAQVRDNGVIIKNVRPTPVNLNATNLASLVISLMSAAAEAQYRKNLDKKLTDIQKISHEIKQFLEADKITLMQGDLAILQNMVKDISIITSNDAQKTSYLTNVIAIRRTAEGNKIFYQNEIAKAMKSHKEKGPKGSKDKKEYKKRTLDDVKRFYSCYKFNMNLLAYTTFVELYLTDPCDEQQITLEKSRLNELQVEMQETADLISQYLMLEYHSKFSNKFKHVIYNGVQKYNELPTPVKLGAEIALVVPGAIDGGAKLLKKAGAIQMDMEENIKAYSEKVEEKTNEGGFEFVGNIVSVDDREMIAEYIKGLDTVSSMYGERISFCINEEGHVGMMKLSS